MAGLVPAIHVLAALKKDVDTRDKRGHDASFSSELITTKSPPHGGLSFYATPLNAIQRNTPHASGTP
ncbi:MAG: hypothetical protein J0H51_17735 [Rhizobiales bacterium]|nr:hypothetical protein [Hyphomicrobiales bacterium]